MLTGRLPFESSSVQEALAQHMTKRPVPVTSLVTDASPALAAAVMRCLEKNPDDRWPTGAALDSALGENPGAGLSLPDGLEHHASRGVKVLAFAYGFGLVFEIAYGVSHDAWWLEIGGIASGLASLALIPSFIDAKLAGLSIRQSLRAFFAAPAKWAGWWPRALRRPGDVWDRLPQPIRRGRNLMLASSAVVLTLFPIFIPLLIAGLRNPGSYLSKALGVAVAANVLGLLTMGLGAGIIQRFAKAQRLPGAPMRRRLIQEPVWGSAFWSRPEIAPLLAPALPAQQADAPSSFAALSAAVADLARDLEPIDPHLAAEVRETARDLGEIIAGFDREIADLATHLDPAESARLEARLRALGEARHDDAGTTSRMHDLIASQLALLEDLRQRQATLEERRAQAIDRLRTLWLHLAGLRARRVLEDADAAEITGRIRALCSDVEHLNTAIDELNVMTPN
jgi:hypothetical protein